MCQIQSNSGKPEENTNEEEDLSNLFDDLEIESINGVPVEEWGQEKTTDQEIADLIPYDLIED
jgi:hypothetical protein